MPKIGSGDWNDSFSTVGNKGKGESIWGGFFLYTILEQFIPICIERNDEILEFNIKPTEVNSSYYLGVTLKQSDKNLINHLIYGRMETKKFAFSILDNIKMLFTGGVSLDQMMGPVGISEAVTKTNGFKEFVYMLALISLSLGVTNLLPIPALDGGKLLILVLLINQHLVLYQHLYMCGSSRFGIRLKLLYEILKGILHFRLILL